MGGCCCKRRRWDSLAEAEGSSSDRWEPELVGAETLGPRGRWLQVDLAEQVGGRLVWLNQEPSGGLRMRRLARARALSVHSALSLHSAPPQPREPAAHCHSPLDKRVSPLNRRHASALHSRLGRSGPSLLRQKVAHRARHFARLHKDGIRFHYADARTARCVV